MNTFLSVFNGFKISYPWTSLFIYLNSKMHTNLIEQLILYMGVLLLLCKIWINSRGCSDLKKNSTQITF